MNIRDILISIPCTYKNYVTVIRNIIVSESKKGFVQFVFSGRNTVPRTFFLKPRPNFTSHRRCPFNFLKSNLQEKKVLIHFSLCYFGDTPGVLSKKYQAIRFSCLADYMKHTYDYRLFIIQKVDWSNVSHAIFKI